MATYVTHLRIADKIFDNFKIQNGALFFVGCIAPDTNVQPDQSHWCTNADKTTCDTDRFYKECIEGNLDKEDIDFYIGYYIHLLTDVLWHKQKIEPIKRISKDEIKRIKQTWRNIDSDFLQKKEGFRPVIMIKKADALEKKWFSYYAIDKVKALTDYSIKSSDSIVDSCVDVDVKNEIDQFIDETAASISDILGRRGL